jgi:hypothetical protein
MFGGMGTVTFLARACFLRDYFLLFYFIRTDVYQLKCLFNLSYYRFMNLVLNVQDDVLCKICLMDCPLSHMVKIEGCGCTFCKEVSQLIQLPVVGISVGDPDWLVICTDPDPSLV